MNKLFDATQAIEVLLGGRDKFFQEKYHLNWKMSKPTAVSSDYSREGGRPGFKQELSLL